MERTGRWLLLIGALGLAVLGQYYFARKPDYVYDGLVFYGLAVVLFLALLRPARASAPEARGKPLRLSAEAMVRAVPVTAGMLLGLAAVTQLNDAHQNYWPIFWTWAAAAGLYLAGFAPWPSWTGAGDRRGQARGGGPLAGLPVARPGPSTGPAAGVMVESAAQPVPQSSAPSLAYRAPSAFALAGASGMGRGRAASRRARWRVSAAAWEWLAAALILLAAFALRAWRVDGIPWTLGGDEGSQGLWARAVIDGQVNNMFGLGWLSVPNMSFFFQAGWFRLLGDNVVGLRLPWAIAGAFTVLGVYLLVRRLFGPWLALLTAFLLATYHFHIHYSRLGSNQVADPLFVAWALYLVVVGRQSRMASGRRWAWAAGGMIAGLSFYFYAGARQAPVILAAALAYAVLVDRTFWREHKLDLLVMLGGFLVVFGPMGLVALQHPHDFNARLNQVGILQSGWLDQAVQSTGRSRLSLLAEQVQRAFLAFHVYPDRVSWYGATIPLMDFAASIFMALGAAFSVSRAWPALDRRDAEGRQGDESAAHTPSTSASAGWRYAIFVIWFVVVIGFGGVLTENPPSSQRLVSSAVPAVFFVAVALAALARGLGDLLHWSRFDRIALSVTLAAVLALISVRYYFGPYQATWAYGNTQAEIATRLGYYLRDLGPGWQEYFFGAPRMYADFGSTPFIARGVPAHDVTAPLVAPFPQAPAQHKLVFVFLPERAGEMQWVQQTYPGGFVEQVHRLGQPNGPLLFIAYRVE